MTRVYDDAIDKNVAKVVVFANSGKALFYDAEFTQPVEATECLNLFMKGVVALYNGTYYAAVSCSDAGVIEFGFPA